MKLRSARTYDIATATASSQPGPTTNSTPNTNQSNQDSSASPSLVASLGSLGRLPGELRNIIYVFVLNTPINAETDLHKPCMQRQGLLLTSKQVRREVKSIIAAAIRARCTHTKFRIKLPTFEETSGGRFDMNLLSSIQHLADSTGSGHCPHDITKAEVITFITGGLGEGAPESVVCYFDPLNNATGFAVNGGTASRDDAITKVLMAALMWVDRALRDKMSAVATGGGDVRADSVARAGRHVEVVLEYLAERVIDAVCEPLEV